MATFSFHLDAAYHPQQTLGSLGLGLGDPCVRLDSGGQACIALPRDSEPCVVQVQQNGAQLAATVTDAHAGWIEPYLPSLLGLDYQLPRFSEPTRLRRLAHQFQGFRLSRSPLIFPTLARVVLQQLVSWRDACHGWRALVRKYGERVPDHADLYVPPTAGKLARMASFQFVECGILPQHGRRIANLARIAERIESSWAGGTASDSMQRTSDLLAQQPGIGPWTLQYTRGLAMRDADAVMLGDYSLPNRVSYFFNGDATADDDRMLEILERYRPHRFYVLSLLIKGTKGAPRRGPRRPKLKDRLMS